MNWRSALLLKLFLACLFLLSASPFAVSGELVIEDVAASKTVLQPRNNEQTTLSFNLSHKAEVTLCIYDSRDYCIKRLIDGKKLPKGNNEVVWDGRDEKGKKAPPNFYIYTIEAKAEGESVVYDPTDLTGGTPISPQNINHDTEAGSINFSLQKAALVNIRAGLKNGGPLMATPLDWLPLPTGNHTVPWDGMDASGVIQTDSLKGLEIGGSGYELPMNALIVLPDGDLPKTAGFMELGSEAVTKREKRVKNNRQMLNHWQHQRDTCYDPAITISLPQGLKRDEKGVAILDGPLPVTINIEQRARNHMFNQRFEIVHYVDFLFQSEEELGFTPYTWVWKHQNMPPGEHYLTVMLRGYEGHFSTATVKVIVP